MLRQNEIDNRVEQVALYFIQTRSTIRQTASKFKISRSTVHKDLTIRLRNIDQKLYYEVRKILDINIDQRAIRGGEATRKKYKNKP